jgi:putative transcriptional regulator
MRNNIKVERAKKNITQAQLAELVQVSRQTINAIELGKYNLSTMLALKMAHIFGCSVNDLFELEQKDWGFSNKDG